jgi:anti-sigma regulatory factor (Ser/Thr protein kinase)
MGLLNGSQQADSPPPGTADALRLEFDSAPDAASAARQALSSLEGTLGPTLMDDARLLATELITNSVRHADGERGAPVGFEVTITARALRIEVMDSGGGFDALTPIPRGASGWGLYLVDRIADRWGVVREKGTRVWFEIDRSRQNGQAPASQASAA